MAKEGPYRDLSAEEKRQIKAAYSKEWKNYQRRIKEAEKKGIVVPESQKLKKVKNPGSWATVNKLKNIGRQSIIAANRREGTGYYIDESTGEITSKAESTGVQAVEPIPPLTRLWTARRNPNRPLSFDEYVKVARKVENLRKTGQIETDYPTAYFGEIKKMRGKNFDESEFLYNEEKSGGYLGSDPNRPLDPKEKEYINFIMRSRGWDLDDEYSYQKIVGSMRGIMPGYDPEEQTWNEAQQEAPAYAELEGDEENITQDWGEVYDDLNRAGELPNKVDIRKSVSSETEDMYAYDSFYSMIQEMTFKSRFAERNRDYLLNELSRLASNQNTRRALNSAIKELAGDDGSIFDVELMYKTGALANFIYRLERLMISFSTFGSDEERENAMDEAEAALEESQDNIVEADIY